jgi:hypothetical protein
VRARATPLRRLARCSPPRPCPAAGRRCTDVVPYPGVGCVREKKAHKNMVTRGKNTLRGHENKHGRARVSKPSRSFALLFVRATHLPLSLAHVFICLFSALPSHLRRRMHWCKTWSVSTVAVRLNWPTRLWAPATSSGSPLEHSCPIERENNAEKDGQRHEVTSIRVWCKWKQTAELMFVFCIFVGCFLHFLFVSCLFQAQLAESSSEQAELVG